MIQKSTALTLLVVLATIAVVFAATTSPPQVGDGELPSQIQDAEAVYETRQLALDNGLRESSWLSFTQGAEARREAMKNWLHDHQDDLLTQIALSEEIDRLYEAHGLSAILDDPRYHPAFQPPSPEWENTADGWAKLLAVSLNQLRRDYQDYPPEAAREAMKEWMNDNMENLKLLDERRQSEAEETTRSRKAALAADPSLQPPPHHEIEVEALPPETPSDVKRIAQLRRDQAVLLQKAIPAPVGPESSLEEAIVRRDAMKGALSHIEPELQQLEATLTERIEQSIAKKIRETVTAR
ncbi:MAG: hypothetical protein ACR2OZ_13665 [Verrucomicrobiales bacterium]